MKERRLFFSIIIPTYNRAELLRRTLRSIQDQVYREFEVIVVDDGGSDNTREVVDSFGDSRFRYIWKPNEERAVARNFGRKQAKGDYVVFFDSDDLALGHFLETARRKLARHRYPEVYASSFRWEDLNGRVLREVILPYDVGTHMYRGNYLSINGVFLRMDIAQDYQFDPELTTAEDWQLWLRLASRYQIIVGKDVTVVQVDHGERSVRNSDVERTLAGRRKMVDSLCRDEKFLLVFGDKVKYLKADGLSYAALHQALTGKRKFKALELVSRSVLAHPANLTRRRTWATLKHIVTS